MIGSMQVQLTYHEDNKKVSAQTLLLGTVFQMIIVFDNGTQFKEILQNAWNQAHGKNKKNTTKQNRACVNFSTGLNDCLKMSHYSLHTPEDIFAKLNGGKIVSKLDMSDVYLQIDCHLV